MHGLENGMSEASRRFLYRKLCQQYSYTKLLKYEDLSTFSTPLEQWEQENGWRIKAWLEHNSTFIAHMRGGTAAQEK